VVLSYPEVSISEVYMAYNLLPGLGYLALFAGRILWRPVLADCMICAI
jgi:hypothetical protein